jgi:RNA ligase
VQVTDKADGSLGILYPLPSGGHAVATRGSFTSEQARHATDVWRQRYSEHAPRPGTTLLFEIIYRENRIVLDYGDLDDLMFLTAVDIATGRSVPYDWQGLRVQSFDYATLAQALTAPPRPNSEGLVVYFPQTDERIKLKQEDYVALHRVLTGLNPRNLWEFLCVNNCKGYITETKRWQSIGLDPARATQILAAGEDWFETMIANVPDEFFDWAKAKIAEIQGAVNTVAKEIYSEFNNLLDSSPDRKTFSELVRGKPHAPALFLLYDNKQIATYLWKQVYPSDTQGWRVVSEDVA